MIIPNEMMIKIIYFCDINTLLTFKNMSEFYIFKNDIDRNIHKIGRNDWKTIHYEHVKYQLKYNIFKKMKDAHIYSFGYGEFRYITLTFPTEKYSSFFYNWWDTAVVSNLNKDNIKIEFFFFLIHNEIRKLRTKYTDYFYRCPRIHPLSLSFSYINSIKKT